MEGILKARKCVRRDSIRSQISELSVVIGPGAKEVGGIGKMLDMMYNNARIYYLIR